MNVAGFRLKAGWRRRGQFGTFDLTSAIGLCLVAVQTVQAQADSSLTFRSNQGSQVVTPESLLSQNEQLRRQLSIRDETVQTLTQSLAESNEEAELFRRKFGELQLRMEALGLAAASKDRAPLEQRLLTAVSDLQLAEKERDEFRDQMMRLSEAILHFLKRTESGDPHARMDVEAQLRATGALVERAKAPAPNPSLLEASVVGLKDEWSFLVGNVGIRQGVKIGMPLRVKRGDDLIATARVVDVRERICGAVMQEAGKNKVRVGDRLEVDARRDLSAR